MKVQPVALSATEFRSEAWGNTKVIVKMEIGKIEVMEDQETTREKSRQFATPVGVPVQDFEAATSRPVIARGDRIGEFCSSDMDEDRADMPMKTPSDQDEEEGVLQQATGPTPLRDGTVDDDDESNEMPAPKRREITKIKQKKKKKCMEKNEKTERDDCTGVRLLSASDAVDGAQHQKKDAKYSLKMETVQVTLSRGDDGVRTAECNMDEGDA